MAAAITTTAVLATLTGGCADPGPARGSGPPVGTALHADGLQLGAVVKLDDIEIGQTYRFGFPVLSNASARPVTILGYRWGAIPTGVRIGRVGVYSDRAAGALVIAYRDGRDEGLHLASFTDHAGEVLRLGPKEDSDLFALIPFTVDRIGTGSFRGCVVTYRTGGRIYQQTFGCTYGLVYATAAPEPAPAPPGSRGSWVPGPRSRADPDESATTGSSRR